MHWYCYTSTSSIKQTFNGQYFGQYLWSSRQQTYFNKLILGGISLDLKSRRPIFIEAINTFSLIKFFSLQSVTESEWVKSILIYLTLWPQRQEQGCFFSYVKLQIDLDFITFLFSNVRILGNPKCTQQDIFNSKYFFYGKF